MNKRVNQGIYAGLIKQYLDFKRSLGFKMKDAEVTLGAFDRLTVERQETAIGISGELMGAWAHPRPHESSTNRHYRVLVVRRFSMYLQMMGYASHVPRLPKRRSTFTPHIYTKAELGALFTASDRLMLPFRYMDSQLCALPSLLRMLYATGLRAGEALALTNGDVHLDDGYLFVRTNSSKNGRERIVPVSGSLIEVCRDYLAYKQRQVIDCGPEHHFFAALSGKGCSPTTMYAHFRRALHHAGIAHHGRGKGPRMHDLRHTFCVDALVRMSEAGMDLYYSMPILSTYIGHCTVESTNRYVRLTAEMYPELIDTCNSAYRYMFPEIWPDGSGPDVTTNIERRHEDN